MGSTAASGEPAPGGDRQWGGTRGSVTAELAVVLPAVTVLLALLLLGVATGLLQLRLEDGARAGARALARGDDPGQVAQIVSKVAGSGVSIAVESSGGYATVTATGRVGGVLSGFVSWSQTAQASARVESAELHQPGRHGPDAGQSPWPIAWPGKLPAIHKNQTGIQKPALWRWARSPECQLHNARCSAVAIAWRDASHVA